MLTKIQLLLLILVTMIGGFMTSLYLNAPALTADFEQAVLQLAPIDHQVVHLQHTQFAINETYDGVDEVTQAALVQLSSIHAILTKLITNSQLENAQYAEQKKAIDAMVAASVQHSKDTNDMLDTILSKMLGKPIGQTFGTKANIKVFSLQEAGYSGYMAKVKLHDPSAVKLVMSNDNIGDKGETTSAAAKRTGATLAINGGGFASQNGLLYPMGITVVDGVIKTFYRTDLSFIGFDKKGNLVGGDISTREQIEEMNIMHGATFVPTLLKNGKKLDIPQKYRNQKQPRTLIGHFSNGDLLFIVIDGRQKSSGGVTLEEAQDKLLEFNVRDAYNLDGGGSSTFVYNGKVLNSPSDGSERRIVSSFVIFP